MTRNPSNWDDYQYGTSPASSFENRTIRFEDDQVSPSAAEHDLERQNSRQESNHDLRRRSSIAQVGGVNSLTNFAESWTRAAAFHEATPHRPSFILSPDNDSDLEDEENTIQYGRLDSEHGRIPRTSLLRARLEADRESVVENEPEAPGIDSTMSRPLAEEDPEGKYPGSDLASFQGGNHSLLAHLGTPLIGSYGTSYGTLQQTISQSSMDHAGQSLRQQQPMGAVLSGEREPLVVKEVELDGHVVLIPVGQSTLPQTIFNSTNVLIGVGLLSLPMGMKYAGWICGMIFLILSALVTAYSARILAKCMDVDASLITFADLAFISFGQKARVVTSVLFTVELLAACVALIVLFADTLTILIPQVGANEWKILCGLLLMPLNFAPLRMLSFSSVIGIFSCFSMEQLPYLGYLLLGGIKEMLRGGKSTSHSLYLSIEFLFTLLPIQYVGIVVSLLIQITVVLIIFIDGFIKPHAPGSLREPAQTYLFPSNWLTLPLSFGLIMSLWGGHSVFPNIYRDMRHPSKFKKAVEVTFSFTYLLDACTAVAGILMFGDGVKDELTANIIGTNGYPRALSIIMTVFIAIIPLTKLPLNARPIVSTLEVLAGLDAQPVTETPRFSGYKRKVLRICIRIFVIVVFVIISILFPAFDSIMAFMGSSLCFTICVILPLLFYLKIFGQKVSMRERVLDYFLIVVCSILATIGTIWAFLPKKLIGAA
ncbi:hypothetical protein B7494_g6038 [Chlorociboria aeruginascens]|nr:hypothetical protein B7494_g6038 [Chlorociboria aeruginascens]